jgi:hypothetical protein
MDGIGQRRIAFSVIDECQRFREIWTAWTAWTALSSFRKWKCKRALRVALCAGDCRSDVAKKTVGASSGHEIELDAYIVLTRLLCIRQEECSCRKQLISLYFWRARRDSNS